MRRRPTPLILAGAAAMAFAATPPAAHASPSQFSIFEAPRELLSYDPGLRLGALDDIRSLGVTHVRVLVRWNAVVRKPNVKRKPSSLKEKDPASAGYNWDIYDALFKEASDRGIEIIPTIAGDAPRWATAKHRGHNYKVSRTRFERFVEAVGTRYGARVNRWTIWNEPNLPRFLTPQRVGGKPYSPRLYRALYQAALQGLGATGNGSDTVLAGETAPSGNARIVGPVTFLKVFFEGKRLHVDGWAHHPYSKRLGPFYRPASRTAVTIGVLDRLTRALDQYSKHRRMKVYLTEFGIQSKPDPNYGVPLLKQAEYRSLSERIAYANPRVAAFSQYLMRDDKSKGKGRGRYLDSFESGLRTPSGKKKPAYEGYRLPLVARRAGSAVKLWGLVRPATGVTTAQVQYRDKGGWKDLGEVRTNARGYWTKRTKLRTGRVYRVRWTDFTGPRTRVY